jgi:hypothetical protein
MSAIEPLANRFSSRLEDAVTVGRPGAHHYDAHKGHTHQEPESLREQSGNNKSQDVHG